MDDQTYLGTVKFYRPKHGFGFIECGDMDYFFHKSGLLEEVQDDDEVLFKLKDSPKGLLAYHVRLATKENPMHLRTSD